MISAFCDRALAFDRVDDVIDDAVLEAHHDVEVAQADVGVDQHDRVAELRERGAEVGGGGRLADPSLA